MHENVMHPAYSSPYLQRRGKLSISPAPSRYWPFLVLLSAGYGVGSGRVCRVGEHAIPLRGEGHAVVWGLGGCRKALSVGARFLVAGRISSSYDLTSLAGIDHNFSQCYA